MIDTFCRFSPRMAVRPSFFRIAVLGASVVAALPVSAQIQGPSSSATPYVLPLNSRISTTSLLSVGDSVNLKPDGVTPYRMVGIPDGMGAFDNGDGTFTVLMNHEIGANQGVVRAHGSIGSFVSKYTIRKDNLQVLRGEDLIQRVARFNPLTGGYDAPTTGPSTAIGRLCSADLPQLSAFFSGGVGYNGRIFMSGEETGSEGLAYGHVVDGADAGTSYQLPRLGKFSWENALANPSTGARTVVVGTDDSTPGEVYVYVGSKTNAGNPVERAGLNNGVLYGIAVNGFPSEDNAAAPTRTAGIPSGTAFTLAPLGDVANSTGTQLQTASNVAGVTKFLRPEDGAWDPRNPNVFYFATTDRFDTIKTGQGTLPARTRLYRLRFADINNPTAGGQIDQVINGTGDYQMFDNMTIDGNNRVMLQEDPGGQAYTARVHQYDLGSNTISPILQFDQARFGSLSTPPVAPFNNDEESSGIIDISNILGRGSYLFNVQAHYNLDTELVQGGQLLVMTNPPNEPLLDLDAATEGVNFSTTFTENGEALPIAANTALVQAGRNLTLNGLTVTLTNRPDGSAESLAANVGTSGLTVSPYNAETGVLTISGNASAEVYQQVLRSISYRNSSEKPTATPRTVTVSIGDGVFASLNATSTIAVVSVNDAPVAVDDAFENSLRFINTDTISVLSNDSDAEGEALTIAVETEPSKGTLILNDNGTFRYDPRISEGGEDSFTYRVTDASGASAVGTVRVRVGAARDATAPYLSINSPLNNGIFRRFPVINGVAFDGVGDSRRGATQASGLSAVRVGILRVSDKFLFNGTSFERETSTQNAVIDGRGFRLATVPSGENLPDGLYQIFVTAIDNQQNATRSDRFIRIDNTAPTAVIDSPRNGQTLSVIGRISGRVFDASGVSRVQLYLRRFDGALWNGTEFVRAGENTFFTLTPSNGRFSYDGPLPTRAQLLNGSYSVIAFAFDRAGNGSQVASSVNIVSNTPR